ncbi:MAG TPA: radical SAM family heme chaperone HemW [bacterium]|nr:radical SAM family heme chaperone HemW [bacterium]
MAGLYIHIPFCEKKCGYCDFYSVDNGHYLIDDYINSLKQELRYYREKYNPSYNTIYIGGGTPTSLSEKQLDYLFTVLFADSPKKNFKEITIEANPETITEKKAKVISLNATRASIGGQSFSSSVLKNLGRIHSAEKTAEAVSLLREKGVGNLNIDLMSGVPGQDAECVINDIKKAAALEPGHISFYMFTAYEGTRFFKEAQGKEADGESPEMYIKGAGALEAAGYRRYEISNFALPGKECVHNMNYWQGGSYIGIGAAASSFFEGSRYTNVKDVEKYIKLIKAGSDPAEIAEKPSKEELVREFIMLGLRMRIGIDEREFRERFKFDFYGKYSKIIDDLEAREMLEKKDGFISLTLKGVLVSNSVISDFF